MYFLNGKENEVLYNAYMGNCKKTKVLKINL